MKYCIYLAFGMLLASTGLAQDAIYNELTRRVFIPSVRIDDSFFARVVLELDENDRFYLVYSDAASEEENEVLARIDPNNCFNAHPLAKLQASEYFGDPEKSLCLRFFEGTGTEGGEIFTYLLIESGVGTLVSDNRRVGFSLCCLEIHKNVSNITAGRNISGEFVSWDSNDPIEIDAKYVLRIELSGSLTVDL